MYAIVNNETDIVEAQSGRPEQDQQGPQMPPPEVEGYTWHWIDEPIDWSGKPSETSVMRWNGGSYHWEETSTIDELRAARNAQINAWKLEANNTYFEFAGKKIAYTDSDRVEIQAINNVVLLTGAMPAHPDWPAAWKAIDNTWAPLPDLAAWTAFNLAIADRGTAHFKRAQELKAALALATTPADIDAITW
jgi:hypothetical protein